MSLAVLLIPPLIMGEYYMRSREQVIWDFVQQWLEKAEGDLEVVPQQSNTTLSSYIFCRLTDG